MAVLPEGMERLDAEDVRGSLRTIEEYIHYMRERLEFAMGGGTAASAAGTQARGETPP